MEFFKTKTNIDFLGMRKGAALLSLVMVVASLFSIWQYGLNLGLDFTGGVQIVAESKEPVDLESMREQLAEAGYEQIVLQYYGTVEEVILSVGGVSEQNQQQLSMVVLELLPDAELKRVDFVGPQVGQELVDTGILAVLVALLLMMVYIALRFQIRFAISAALSLAHDPIIVLGIFAYFQLEFNLIALAAILTVVGYSINDSIVVFDRARENFKLMRKATTEEVLNMSINQTLSRTIMTSGLTLLVIFALLFYGGDMLQGFSIALALGIVIGTYSSIYIASPLALFFGLTPKDMLPSEKEELDDRP